MKTIACVRFNAFIAASIALVGVAASGVANGQRPKTALLGSPDFHPSAKQPVGWRGDGTGSFPAATPPLEWFRRPIGAFNSIWVLADQPKSEAPKTAAPKTAAPSVTAPKSNAAKPKTTKPSATKPGAVAAESAAGEPLNMGTVREWLVVGPFDAKDHATSLDEISQPDEATMQPAAGQKLNGKPWTVMRVSVANQSQSWSRLTLDLALAYGMDEHQERQNHPGTLEPRVAYACTHLYSAEAGRVRMHIEATKAKAWLNGEPVKVPANPYAPTPVVELHKGWNLLMVKMADNSKNWNMSTLIFPVADGGYETKNIRWMAAMPGPSWSSPIVVGSKIFVNADDCTLVCLNKEDGQTLWTRDMTYYRAIGDEERKDFADLAPKVAQLDALVNSLPEALNAALSVDGSKAEMNKPLQTLIARKRELERDIREGMSKSDKTYRTWGNDRGWTTPTPVSDGKYVYVAYHGGQKGLGCNVVACFDLDGKVVWSHFTGQTGIGEHGTHSTPVLSGNMLVHISGSTIFGYDKTTGKVVWTQKTRGYTVTGASLIALKSGNVDVVFAPQAGIYRTSDGAELWKSNVTAEISTPTVVNGVVCGISDFDNKSEFYEFRLPPLSGSALQPEFLGKAPWKPMTLEMPGQFSNSIIGSPLVNNGLFYIVSEGGALTVVDARTGRTIYTKPLEDLEPRLTWVFRVGVSTGPTLAGKYIHIRDDQSQTIVIAPGPKYQELAKNVLWELQPDGNQQEAQSNPFYEGSRIYYRTQDFLYCIGE
jgi:outer membrane protein assembly factor BamB